MKAIVLAAGCSRRMGQLKQLLSWQGKTLIQHRIDTLNTAGFEVITVLGSNADKIQPQINQTQVVVNENWTDGMGSSIVRAVKELNADVTSVLITLGDQIALTSDDYVFLKMAALQNPKKIICSHFDTIIKDDKNKFVTQEILGVPAIFPREYFSELKKLKKNTGARKIIQSAMSEYTENKDTSDKIENKVHPVPLANASININTPEDWHHWQQLHLHKITSGSLKHKVTYNEIKHQ